MNKQLSLSSLSDELARVRSKKKEFLEQIERIVPWGEWEAIIRPCYYKGEQGEQALRIGTDATAVLAAKSLYIVR